MKNFSRLQVFFFLVILTMVAAVTSCSDDDAASGDTLVAEVTTADAVDAIEATLSFSGGGFAKMMDDASALADDQGIYTETPAIACGQQYTAVYSAATTSTPGYIFSGNRMYSIECTAAGMPVQLNYSFMTEGVYNTTRISATGNEQGNFHITGLAPGTPDAVFNGALSYNGSHQALLRENHYFTSAINFTLSNVRVNKMTREISGGTVALTFNATGQSGAGFSFTGTITFDNTDTATLQMDGNNYTLSLL